MHIPEAGITTIRCLRIDTGGERRLILPLVSKPLLTFPGGYKSLFLTLFSHPDEQHSRHEQSPPWGYSRGNGQFLIFRDIPDFPGNVDVSVLYSPSGQLHRGFTWG